MRCIRIWLIDGEKYNDCGWVGVVRGSDDHAEINRTDRKKRGLTRHARNRWGEIDKINILMCVEFWVRWFLSHATSWSNYYKWTHKFRETRGILPPAPPSLMPHSTNVLQSSVGIFTTIFFCHLLVRLGKLQDVWGCGGCGGASDWLWVTANKMLGAPTRYLTRGNHRELMKGKT